jgi:single-strand DNA-binding protein
MKVVLENFQFLGSGRSDGTAPAGGGEGGGSYAPRASSAPKPAAPPAAQENLDEDVPF